MCYEKFAKIYDASMRDVPYEEWLQYVKAIWKREQLVPKLVLDMGCGTGSFSVLLAKDRNIEVIGSDHSPDMLSVAKEKAEKENVSVLFLCQDMQGLELYGTVDSIICLFDSINYITEKDELLQVFRLVNLYLNPSGLFIFDMNTEYKFREILKDNSYIQTYEEGALIWENFYDAEEKINEYKITGFVQQAQGGLYEKFEEEHYEKAYEKTTVCELLKEAGLELAAVYDAYTFDPPRKDSERIFYVAKEVQKEKNL